jgi:hypothetical protein
MATILQAVNALGPKLELNQTAELREVANWMSMRTGVKKSEVQMILQEASEAILYFNCQGTPVRLPGVGTFTPTIGRRGTKRINLRNDPALKNGINAPGAYTGKIRNKSRIGLDDQGYKDLWDPDHRDNPLEI